MKLETMLEICNAANAAIAQGYILEVRINGVYTGFYCGMLVKDGRLHGLCKILSGRDDIENYLLIPVGKDSQVVAVKPIGIDERIIHSPPDGIEGRQVYNPETGTTTVTWGRDSEPLSTQEVPSGVESGCRCCPLPEDE